MTLLFSLIGGLLVAVALQLVFANLGVAIGLSFLNWSPSEQRQAKATDKALSEDELSSEKSESNGSNPETSEQTKRSLPITHLLGFGVALGFSATIFIAALLSTEFSELIDPRRGIIFGLVVWATYWALFLWLSSTTIVGIADSLFSNVLVGGKQLLATIKQTVKQTVINPIEKRKEKATESSEQAILKELSEQVSQLASKQQELPALLAQQRQTLLEELEKRANVASESADAIAHSSTTSPAVAPSSKSESTSEPDSPIAAIPVTAAVTTPRTTLLSQLDLPSWQQILRRTLNQVDLSEWDVETIWEHVPITEENVQYATTQLKESAISVLPDTLSTTTTEPNTLPKEEDSIAEHSHFQEKPKQQTKQCAAVKAIETKLIAYCRYTNIDSLTPQKLTEKVKAQRIEQGLPEDFIALDELLDIDKIENTLRNRKKLSPQKRKQLLQALKSAWPTQPATAFLEPDEGELNENKSDKSEPDSNHLPSSDDLSFRTATEKAYKALENHIQSIDWSSVSLEDIKPEISLLLEQIERKGTLRSLDWNALTTRIQLLPTARAEVTTWLQTVLLSKVNTLRPVALSSAQNISSQLAEQITYYLHHQDKSALQPKQLMQNMTALVGSTIATFPQPATLLEEIPAIPTDFSADFSKLWDKDTWQQTLEARKDLTQDEIQQIITWGETFWQPKAAQLGTWLQAIQQEIRERVALPDPDSLVTPLSNALSKPIDTAREQILGQLATAQEKLRDQATDVKEDIQRQADAARRQVAIAAWWLFIALLSSGSAAASAGWLATRY
ncbi:MAG: hypothetical protein AAFY72_06355 [Cyanobacteria bacterium J06649_4]